MNETIERIELKRITRLSLDNISGKMSGVYAVFFPNGNMVKYGRASSLKDRLISYDELCIASGGVIVMYKTLAPQMIVTAEKTLLSMASKRLKLIHKNEFFACESAEMVQQIMSDSLEFLTHRYVTVDALLEPFYDKIDPAILSSVRKPLHTAITEEAWQIYNKLVPVEN